MSLLSCSNVLPNSEVGTDTMVVLLVVEKYKSKMVSSLTKIRQLVQNTLGGTETWMDTQT